VGPAVPCRSRTASSPRPRSSHGLVVATRNRSDFERAGVKHGIPSLQYGAGDIRTYREWPTPDERVKLSELVIAARAIAYATWNLCG
jgi:hypothetical protein